LGKNLNLFSCLADILVSRQQKWHRESPGALCLIGFAASGLVYQDSGQQSLFPESQEEKQKRRDEAIDKIRNRYSNDSLR